MSTGGFSGVTNNGQGAFSQEEARQIAEENERNVKASLLISNKFPNSNQRGKRYDFTIINGRIQMKQGIRLANFVIDENGSLHLGNGHSFLANGKSVLAAGTLKVDKRGYIRRIVNNSGHYQPTPIEAARYPPILTRAGLNVNNSWIEILRFQTTASKYIKKLEIVYHGPVKYLRRRLK